MNDETKTLIRKKNWLYQRLSIFGSLDYNMLNVITTDISNAVISSKFKYHDPLSQKLNNPKTAAKPYWSISKTF